MLYLQRGFGINGSPVASFGCEGTMGAWFLVAWAFLELLLVAFRTIFWHRRASLVASEKEDVHGLSS